MRQLKSTRGGFSMVETLMVLAIAGILVTMSFGYLISARPAAELERGEIVLQQTLVAARNLAMSDEVTVQVIIDTDNGTLTIESAEPGTGNFSAAMPMVTLPSGVGIATTSFEGDTIVFTSRGSLVSGGNITISNNVGTSRVYTGQLASGRFPLLEGNLR
jgi:prepilin-type N-terminal cleavage/methylation domain-containing protein